MKTLRLSVAAALLLPTLLVAETVTLEPLDVITTPLKTDELTTAGSVEVYTAKDIENAQVSDIYQFLNQVSSINAVQSYGNPFIQRMDLRGYGLQEGFGAIVVTLNGRKLNNMDNVPQFLGSIPPTSVERIEIFKGGGIVLHGDGANGGVVNIVTKRSDEKSVTVYGGTYHTFNGSFYVGEKEKEYALGLQGTHYKTNGIRFVDDNGNKEAQKMTNGTFDFAYFATDALELRVGAAVSATDSWFSNYLTLEQYNSDPVQKGSYSTHQTISSDQVSAGATYDLTDTVCIDADLSREKKESNFLSYGSVYNYVYDAARLKVAYENSGLKVITGVDLHDGNREAFTAFGNSDITKDNLGGYVMVQYMDDDHTLKAGYRRERVRYKSTVDDPTEELLNGVELGYNYRLDKKQALFAEYSHAFQSADIDRLFSITTGLYTGYVKPAISDNYNVGYRIYTKRYALKSSLFYTDLKNEIYYYADTFTNTNIDRSHKYGAEIEAAYKLSEAWNIGLNYSYVRAIIDEEVQGANSFAGNDLPGVPKHNAKLSAAYKSSARTTWVLSQLYRSESYAADDVGNSFTQRQEAFMSTDLGVTYKTEKYDMFAKITNLFNQSNGLWIKDDAIYPVNFTTTAIAGFKLKF
jgi:iron complex outermembrane receptor protein